MRLYQRRVAGSGGVAIQMTDIRDHASLRWKGALQVTEHAHGLQPSRVPPTAQHQVPFESQIVASMCAGVRLAFRSDTRRVEVVAMPVRMAWPGAEAAPVVFDLVVNGTAVASCSSEQGFVALSDLEAPEGFTIEDRGPAQVIFEDLAAGVKDIEVWLPQGAGVDVTNVFVDTGAVVEPVPARSEWIHYGSSISHCIEASRPTGIWQAVAARGTLLDVVNLGFAGDCHVDQYIARHIRDSDAALISLKLGTNTFTTLTERTFPSAVHGFLDTVRDGHPITPVVLCSPIFCPSAENNVGPMVLAGSAYTVPERQPEHPVPGLLTLAQTRTILEGIVEARRAAGDNHLFYLSGLELMGKSDAHFLHDDLHPNSDGYEVMGERFAERVFAENGLVPHSSLGLSS